MQGVHETQHLCFLFVILNQCFLFIVGIFALRSMFCCCTFAIITRNIFLGNSNCCEQARMNNERGLNRGPLIVLLAVVCNSRFLLP